MAKSYKVSVFAGTKVVADMAQQVKNATIEASIQLKTIKGGATSATPTILAPGPSGANRKMEDVQGWFVNGTAANPPVATGTPWEAPAGNKNTNWWNGTTWSLGSSVPLPKGQGLLALFDAAKAGGYAKDAQVRDANGVIYVSLKDGNTSALSVKEDWKSLSWSSAISASNGWKIVAGNAISRVTIVKTTDYATGFFQIEGRFLVFNYAGGFYYLNSVKIDFTSGNDIFYLSESATEFIPLNATDRTIEGRECFVRTMPLGNERNFNTVVIGVSFAGAGWDSEHVEFSLEKGDMQFVLKPSESGIKVEKNADLSINVTITERTPIFSQRLWSSFLWINPQTIKIPNGSYLVLKRAGTIAGTFAYNFNTKIPSQTYVDFDVVDYNYYDFNFQNAVIAFNWNGSLNSRSECLLTRKQQGSEIDIFRHIEKFPVRNEIAPFIKKVNELTDNDPPLDIMLLGDSINNFQHTGGAETWKTDKTVEPQSLYGNTLARFIWRYFNYTFSNRLDDSVAIPFSNKKPEEWGNLRFLRVDNANVVKNGEFIPHGTRKSDGKRIYWGQREYIGQGSTALGGFRGVLPDKDLITTTIGEIETHNRVYFFNKDLDSSLQFTIDKAAKGFSVVFWGDIPTFGYPQINGETWLYLSRNVQVEVNGVIIDNLDLTTYRGQSRKDYNLMETGGNFVIKLTNKDSGRLMNFWGLEYWVGKCVRLTNYALAGNSTHSYMYGNSSEYWIDNKKADLIFWQLSNLNNAGGYAEQNNFKAMGQKLKTLNVPILATNCHSPIESNPTSTNYKELATAEKVWQHPDVWGAGKGLQMLGIPYLDSWAVFSEIGFANKFMGEYADLLIDTAHLAEKGRDLYIDIFKKVLI